MRIFVMLAIIATVVVIGYGISTRVFTQSHSDSSVAAVPSTMSPHEIHLDYKGMEKLPVHDVKDAF
jgi:hypothetical protein